jgi:hypothetical protein
LLFDCFVLAGLLVCLRVQDMKEAFKDADGRKLNNRRIVVDVERGRTVKVTIHK